MEKNPTLTLEAFQNRCREEKDRRWLILLRHAREGVRFVDAEHTYIDEEVTIGQGTLIHPDVTLSGSTRVGKDCIIGSGSRIVNSSLADQVEVQASHILDSSLGRGTRVGPFAYIRPGCRIGEGVKIGDFVEIKNSVIGEGTKVPHLTYVGDADLGEGINLGCGVVFVNYDGLAKHRSTVEDGAFIGCNVNLISPITVGEKAYVAAGSTLTQDVPPGALAVARARQENLPGWVARRGLLDKKSK